MKPITMINKALSYVDLIREEVQMFESWGLVGTNNMPARDRANYKMLLNTAKEGCTKEFLIEEINNWAEIIKDSGEIIIHRTPSCGKGRVQLEIVIFPEENHYDITVTCYQKVAKLERSFKTRTKKGELRSQEVELRNERWVPK